MTEHTDKALTVDVYRNANRHLPNDTTNGGASASYARLVVTGSAGCPLEGYIWPDEEAAHCRRNCATTATLTKHMGWPIVAVAPTPAQLAQAKGRELCGPMMGGNYAASSDSRWVRATGGIGAVPIHDRWETHEQYERLSR